MLKAQLPMPNMFMPTTYMDLVHALISIESYHQVGFYQPEPALG